MLTFDFARHFSVCLRDTHDGTKLGKFREIDSDIATVRDVNSGSRAVEEMTMVVIMLVIVLVTMAEIVLMMVVMLHGHSDENISLTCWPKCDRVACHTRAEACKSSARSRHEFKLRELSEVWGSIFE